MNAYENGQKENFAFYLGNIMRSKALFPVGKENLCLRVRFSKVKGRLTKERITKDDRYQE